MAATNHSRTHTYSGARDVSLPHMCTAPIGLRPPNHALRVPRVTNNQDVNNTLWDSCFRWGRRRTITYLGDHRPGRIQGIGGEHGVFATIHDTAISKILLPSVAGQNRGQWQRARGVRHNPRHHDLGDISCLTLVMIKTSRALGIRDNQRNSISKPYILSDAVQDQLPRVNEPQPAPNHGLRVGRPRQ